MRGADLFNWEAEERIVGFLLNPHVSQDKKEHILHTMSPEYFSNTKYSVVFAHIKFKRVFDKIILWDRINQLREAKGIAQEDIISIDEFTTEKEIDSYVEIVSDKFQKRKVYEFGQSIQDAILKGEDQYEVALKAQLILTSMGSKSQIDTNQELLDKVLNEQPGDVLKTGFRDIDQVLGGYARGMLVTIAGDSGHMKTTLALDKAFRMAEANPKAKIGIFSKEMLATELIKKQIARICNIPISKIFQQEYDKEYVKSKMMEIDAWRENRIRIINPNSFFGVTDIARIQMTHRFDIWFLDFIQLLEFAKAATTSSDYNVQIGQNMRNLQSLALATKSVGIILSQVKKGIEIRKAKRPTISDIEWSGLIKQLSSYIFFSYYPGKYYGFDAIPEDHYYLIAEKTRFAETFIYPLRAIPQYGTFEEIETVEERQQIVNNLKKISEG